MLITIFTLILVGSLLRLKRYYLEHLRQRLYSENPADRLTAIDLFAEKIQKNSGEKFLLRFLKDRRCDEKTRQRIIAAIALIGNAESIPELIPILEKAPVKNRFAAIQAVNTLMKSRKVLRRYPLTKHLLLTTYEKMFISDVPLFLKLEILHALQNFDLDEVIGFLEKNLRSDDFHIQSNAIEVLGTFDDRSVIYYLRPFLQSADPHVVCAAIVGLWKYADTRIDLVQVLIRLLTADDRNTVEAALFVISSLMMTWEKHYVMQKLAHPDEKIRIYALFTLIRLGETTRLDGLLQEMLALKRRGNEPLLEFALSRYRRLEKKVKKMMLRKIQHLSALDIASFYRLFEDSQYIFEEELAELR